MNIVETVLIVFGVLFVGAILLAVIGRLLSSVSDDWSH